MSTPRRGFPQASALEPRVRGGARLTRREVLGTAVGGALAARVSARQVTRYVEELLRLGVSVPFSMHLEYPHQGNQSAIWQFGRDRSALRSALGAPEAVIG